MATEPTMWFVHRDELSDCPCAQFSEPHAACAEITRLRAEVSRLSAPPDDATIERAAKAIYRANLAHTGFDVSTWDLEAIDMAKVRDRNRYRSFARAALSAYREPKEGDRG